MPDTTPTPEAAAIGKETANILLDIKAVNFRPEEPYILTSGWASPVYIDCRKIISFNTERRRIMTMAAETLRNAGLVDDIDFVAGGETAGIPYAAWMSDEIDKPMLYIRKKPKGFGRDAQIEGHLTEGSHVLLVEDLATDGASKVNFVNAIRNANATVTDTIVVFFYGVFPGALKDLSAAGVNLHYLATWQDVLEAAAEGGYFPPESIEEVRKFLADPAAWSTANGGKSD